jgi:D-aminopeptidase
VKVFIITDLEGVNGVLNFPDWCVPEGRRNETACRFLTEEVNAAVAGFFEGGATEVIVLDGHGSGGSIRGEMLDPRAALQRGAKTLPTFNDDCDVAAFIGQHAKAGTPNAHLAHTQTGDAVDFRINGVSIGEFGQLSYGFYELGIPVIFASGDLALTREAKELIPGIFTVAVKEGFNPPLDENCPTEEVMARQSAALHYPREKVLADLRTQAEEAVKKYRVDSASFRIKPLPAAPYQAVAEYRATAPKDIPVLGDLPPRRITTSFHNSIAGVFREFYCGLEWGKVVEGEHYTLL